MGHIMFQACKQEGANQAIAPHRIFQKHVQLLGTTSSCSHFPPKIIPQVLLILRPPKISTVCGPAMIILFCAMFCLLHLAFLR